MISRIEKEEALYLFTKAPLQDLQERACKIRNIKNPSDRVTFILDSNPNYTNICHADCTFCAFYRKETAADAYTKSIKQVMEHFALARKAGLRTVLLQGGLHESLDMDYYTTLVKTACKEYPDIHLHGFSAPEIWNMSKVSHLSIREVLLQLWKAGLRTIPGGGAEILSERVRKRISPKKMEPGVWMQVHKIAHEVGYKTTATMMYGHVETPEDIIEHLDVLREAQDQIAGFTAFIPWSYKRENTALRRVVKNWVGVDAYYRILAIARIYLDNFDHIQATWFSEGKEVGIKSLHYGADDFGGIILEENVHKATNHINKTHIAEVIHMIKKSGFIPAQRTTLYDIIETYESNEQVEVPVAQEYHDIMHLSH